MYGAIPHLYMFIAELVMGNNQSNLDYNVESNYSGTLLVPLYVPKSHTNLVTLARVSPLR